MITKVVLTRRATSNLSVVPCFIADKFEAWVRFVEKIGIDETRKIQSYHDEPLIGKWKGFRSIRLNRSYRAIYKISGEYINFIEIYEVNKHDY